MSTMIRHPRILFTVAHYFDANGDGYYGSTGDNRNSRTAALTASVRALHQHFGVRQSKLINRKQRIFAEVNTGELYQVDIVICTSEDKHLIDDLRVPSGSFEHRKTSAEGMLLPFECHSVLQERLGDYDFYCYIEDDLIILDQLFFSKLRWFNDRAGDQSLLQPNRYELSLTKLAKLYIDGHISKKFTNAWQNVDDEPKLHATVMGRKFVFERPTNPHSGCFFVNTRQLEIWIEKPYFLDRDTSFVGPLESAATLGIMKTFRIYKPAPESAGFFELLHANNRYLGS